MLRLFQVYYPIRRLLLVFSEASITYVVLMIARAITLEDRGLIIPRNVAGWTNVTVLCIVVITLAHYLDLYAPECVSSRGETYIRMMLMFFSLAAATFAIKGLIPTLNRFISSPVEVILLAPCLVLWRAFYIRVLRRGYLRQRVFVLGCGPRALHLVQTIRSRFDLGMEIVGWDGSVGNDSFNREHWIRALRETCSENNVKQIIVALDDPRGCMPTDVLLELWVSGITVQEASTLLERADGRIELEGLTPSALMYSEGFRLNRFAMSARRLLSLIAALTVAIVVAPLVPFIIFAIWLSSPGPVLLRQQRVGLHRKIFTLYKFRSMRLDAEADGPKWAIDPDPRVTPLGRFLRMTRLDEIPQLWNILRGDMNFVGPRPERPEFVDWLSHQVPYYELRHIVRPGLTGWAQTRYRYSSSLEQTKRKLQYDLYYIKHMSLSLDVIIMFETIKTIIRRRGAQ